MDLIFMGTPDFAVGALEAIIQAGHHVAAVVTQPDKPKGRGKEIQIPPVKKCALAHQIPVFQPVRIKEPETVETLRNCKADIIVVAAFGQILPEEILRMPKYGCVNIHASLLPEYRGAAPIQWAIIDGKKTTGVTIMQMDKGLDTGDILLKREVAIDPKETGDSLHDKLAETGAQLITEALPKIERGELVPVRQGDHSTYAKMLQKSMGRIDWRMGAEELDCFIRGMISWPGASASYRGRTLKIWDEEVAAQESIRAKERDGRPDAETLEDIEGSGPGTVVRVEKDAFYVKTGDGFLKILEVQPEGRKRMSVKDFLLGHPIKAGDSLDGSGRDTADRA